MTKLVMPKDGPRIKLLGRDSVNAYVRSEYDKSIHTWGIPNNLIRTMACLPQLGLTEVDYANSFIFDENTLSRWPDPRDTSKEVLFPMAGFNDRVTKELVINLVSLLNRSRYSITHHTVIGFGTLSAAVGADKAESMLLHLVDESGQPDFEHRNDLYDHYQLAAMELALKLRGSGHDVSNEDFEEFRNLSAEKAKKTIENSEVLSALDYTSSEEYLSAYVDGMIVEMTWCIVHFAGLLNKWFTVIKVMDEVDADIDGIDFISVYNSTVPEKIKVRNNALLGKSGWGSDI